MPTPESILTYPCDFLLKVMGENHPEFEATVISIVRNHVPTLGEAAVSRRDSNQQRYVSLSVQFIAHSRAQLDALYQELHDCPRVLMTL
jgi:uncharacterized protein